MIGALVVGHKDFSESIIRAAGSIAGTIDNIDSISNDGLSTDELAENIKVRSAGMQVDGLFIFVDVFGGSCWRGAKMAKVENAHILTGTNLPMILSFLHKRGSYSLDELSQILETDAKRGVTVE